MVPFFKLSGYMVHSHFKKLPASNTLKYVSERGQLIVMSVEVRYIGVLTQIGQCKSVYTEMLVMLLNG